ncbi:MAG: hypothetical protein RIQ46_818 [Pseudomonadota bacterium]|jgi:hypothetical protein
MRKVVAYAMLVVVAAPMLGGCSGWLGGSRAARSQPAGKAAPMSPQEAALLAGKDALRQGQYAAAITDFRIARLDPALEAEAFNGLAIAYSNIGRPDLSERYFRQAVALAPDDRRFAANLARFRQITGDQPMPAAPASFPALAQTLAQAPGRTEASPVPQPAPVLAGAVVSAVPSPTGSVAVVSRAPDPSGPVGVVVSGPAKSPAAVAVRVGVPAPAPVARTVPPAVVLSRVAANEVVIGVVRARPAVAARAPRKTAAPAVPVARRRLALVDRPATVRALYRSQRPGRAIDY